MPTTATLTVMTNDFHGTEYRTTKTRDELNAIDQKAPWHRTETEQAFVRKVRRTLCGIEGCTCGTNSFGER
jgi:hypothetical protein